MASNSDACNAFWSGTITSNCKGLAQAGDKLFSYGTVILQRLSSGKVIGNATKYSVTTSKHQSQARVNSADVTVTGVPRGSQDLQPYIYADV